MPIARAAPRASISSHASAIIASFMRKIWIAVTFSDRPGRRHAAVEPGVRLANGVPADHHLVLGDDQIVDRDLEVREPQSHPGGELP